MVTWLGGAVFTEEIDADWLGAIAAHNAALNDEERQSLSEMSQLVSGLNLQDKSSILSGLLALRDVAAMPTSKSLSAELLLGSAKALRNLKRMARVLAFEVPEPAGEFYVLTAGPAAPKTVILIENLRCFTAFAGSAHAKESMAIAAYGYGLSLENFGARLAAGQVIACPAYGERIDLRDVLPRTPIFFWGDLDLEGLRIFESLCARLPSIQLSAAYAAMENMLDDPRRSHPYHDLFEKAGQRGPLGLSPHVKHLAACCAQRAVDQEMLCDRVAYISVTQPYDPALAPTGPEDIG